MKMVGRPKSSAAPQKNMDEDLENLQNEIASLKKRNIALAKTLAEFQTKAREIEKERNMFHADNVNLLTENRQLRTRMIDGGRTIITMLLKTSNEVTNVMTNQNVSNDSNYTNVSTPDIEKSIQQRGSETRLSAKVHKTQAVKPMVSGHIIYSPKIHLRRLPTEDLLSSTNRNELEVATNVQRPSISLNNSLNNYDEAEASTSGLSRSNTNIVQDLMLNVYDGNQMDNSPEAESPESSVNPPDSSSLQTSKLSTVLELAEDLSVSNSRIQNSLLSGVFQGSTVNVYLNRDEVSQHLSNSASTSPDNTIVSNSLPNGSKENIENEDQDRFVSKRSRIKTSRSNGPYENSKRLKSINSSISRSSDTNANNYSTRSKNSTLQSSAGSKYSEASEHLSLSLNLSETANGESASNSNSVDEHISSTVNNSINNTTREYDAYDPQEGPSTVGGTIGSRTGSCQSIYDGTPSIAQHMSTPYSKSPSTSVSSTDIESSTFTPRRLPKEIQRKSKMLVPKIKTPKKQKMAGCSVVLKRMAIPKKKSLSPRNSRRSTTPIKPANMKEDMTEDNSENGLIMVTKRIRKKKIIPDCVPEKIKTPKLDSPMKRPKRKAQPSNLQEKKLNRTQIKLKNKDMKMSGRRATVNENEKKLNSYNLSIL